MKKIWILFIFCFLSNDSLVSQNSTSSPYSFYGIGSLNFKGTAENRSMGRLTIHNDSIHMNFSNPASFSGNNMFSFNNEGRLVKFTVGLGHSETKLNTENQQSEVSNSSFDYLGLNVPMGKFGFGFGLIPHTSVGYQLESLNSDNLIKYNYFGSGGLNKTFLGFGYQVNDNFSVGIGASYNFGNLNNSAIEFLYDDEMNPLAYQTRQEDRSDLSGINYKIGLIYSDKITSEIEFTTSVVISPKHTLTSKNSRNYATVGVNSNNQVSFIVNEINVDLEPLGLHETDIIMPLKTSLGIGFGKIKKWFVGAEYTSINSQNFSNGLLEIDNSQFEDYSLYSIGGFYIPDYSSFGEIWKRFVYRGGFYYEKTGLVINSESIDEFGISFGLGIPAGGLFSNVNTTVEFGKRGTTNENLVEENFINFQLSLSLNDRWFIKRKYN